MFFWPVFIVCLVLTRVSGLSNIWGDVYQANKSHYARDCTFLENDELYCTQHPAPLGSIRVGCIGDSITAVGHTSSVAHHYPDQLQNILDTKHGQGTYSVTNLGVCGSSLQREGAKPWWNTAAYQTLVSNRWDVIIVMLGSNDAGATQGYWPLSNQQNCDNASIATLDSCNYANAYRELLELIATVGSDNGKPPEIHIMIPPSLMQNGAYSMNQTIINTVFPRLIPIIAKNSSDLVNGVIDIYTGLGGVPAPEWQTKLPSSCTLNSTWPPCAYYCDEQSCNPGQVHPNDVGEAKLAQVVYDTWLG